MPVLRSFLLLYELYSKYNTSVPAENKTVTYTSLKPSSRFLLMLRVLAIVALGLSAYLAWNAWNGKTDLLGCSGEDSGCNEVTQTKWSQWLGLPVSAGGLLVYAGIFVCTFALARKSSRLSWQALLALAVLASASAIWFMGLQIFVVGSYCYYCMAIHACGIAIAILTFRNLPLTGMKDERGKKRRAEEFLAGHALRAVFAGLAGVAILAAGQLYPSSSPPVVPSSSTPPPSNQPISSQPAIPRREVSLLQGKLHLNAGEYPVIGPLEAPHYVAHFFDYTCPACRAVHPSLMNAQQVARTGTAIIMMPMPLDAACNAGIPTTSYQHRDACLYAKLGLALWSIRPEAYTQFDTFMFQGEFPPPLSLARSVADQLAGKEAMDTALSNPLNEQLIQQDITWFYSSLFEQKALPILVTAQEAHVGVPAPALLSRLFQ